MFCKVMLNEELCKEMLEKLLGIKVHHLKYIEEEKRLDFRKDAKGIRLDVYVEDGAYKVFFNAYGTAGNVNKDVKAF